MAYFPFMMDIQNKDCLIVGGGTIAYRKVLDLLQFGAKVTVVSLEICKDILECAEVTIVNKKYESKDIHNRFLVIAATDEEAVNRQISSDCQERNILVNAVDIKDACTFIFPAIVKKDDLVIGISTGGNSPAGAAYLKEKIEKSIPKYYEKNMAFLGSVRSMIMEKIDSFQGRKKLYYALLKKADKEERMLQKEDVLDYMEHLK